MLNEMLDANNTRRKTRVELLQFSRKLTLSTILQRVRGRFHDNVWEARATKFGRRGRFHDKLGAEVMKSSGRISLKLEQTLFQVHFTRQILISDHEKVMVQRYRKLKIWAFWLEVPARKLRVRVSGHNCSPAR